MPTPSIGSATPSALVVDDSPFARKVIAAGLRRAGLEVHEAGDGAEALAQLRGGFFDLVVTDLQMPGMGGRELLERMRAEGISAEVVLLTGADDVETALGGLHEGAHGYVLKGPGSSQDVVRSARQALEKGRRPRDENAGLTAELRSLGLRDVLTGLPNRRAFEAGLDGELERAGRAEPLSLLVAGLDRLKAVNDTWGQTTGDLVLKHFAALATRAFRPPDAVYRVGGDEFAVLLTGTGLPGAREAATRLVEETGRSALDVGSTVLRMTCSVGVVSFFPTEGTGLPALLGRAGAAMREAKAAGRNRVALAAVFGESPPLSGRVIPRRR